MCIPVYVFVCVKWYVQILDVFIVLCYSRFKHLCNRKTARTKTTSVVNLISQRQLYWTSLYSSTRVVFKVVWLLQGCINWL